MTSVSAHEQCVTSLSDSLIVASSFVHDNVSGPHDILSTARELVPVDVEENVVLFDSNSTLVFVQLHDLVRASGLPNYKLRQYPVPSRLRIPEWRTSLVHYHDSFICDFLEFGWPLEYHCVESTSSGCTPRNHAGARNFSAAVTQYLQRERSYNAVIGPFQSNPFSSDVVILPLNSVPKSVPGDRRIILDLSWPDGASVNDGISAHEYLGEEIWLTYPSVDDIAERIVRYGRGCLIFKRDLKRAYRQFPVDPTDYHLLGYEWNGDFYIDVVLPMGLRMAAMAGQRVTSGVSYIYTGYDVINYLDDFIEVSLPAAADEAFEFCGRTLSRLGLEESLEKACSPSTRVICLGVEFDTVNMTMAVTQERLHELELLLQQWSHKLSATKRELQSLIGKLSFVTKCVRQSRLFLTRLLDLLRTVSRNHHHLNLNREFHRDLEWWQRFLRVYNGVSVIGYYLWSEPDAVFSTDACLSGCGGLSAGEYFHTEFPSFILQEFPHIHHLELIAIVLAVRLWGHLWSGLRVRVYCDNKAVAHALNTGRVKDPLLARGLRELWFNLAVVGCELRAVHLSSEQNRDADLLSRWHLHDRFSNSFLALPGVSSLKDRHITSSLFQFTDAL